MADDKVDDSLFHPETFKRAPGYKVVAPMVNLVTATPQGYRMLAFHSGAPVPADVSDESVFYHLRDKLIAEVDVPAPVLAEPEQVPVKAPEQEQAPVKPAEQDTGKAPEAGPDTVPADAAKTAPAARTSSKAK